MSVDEIKTEVIEDLTVELHNDATFDADKLAVKVKNAIKDVMVKRNYQATNFTEERIAEDLQNYYSVIVNVARYDYNQIGAEGETNHTENGTTRTYMSRESLFSTVHAFVKVL